MIFAVKAGMSWFAHETARFRDKFFDRRYAPSRGRNAAARGVSATSLVCPTEPEAAATRLCFAYQRFS